MVEVKQKVMFMKSKQKFLIFFVVIGAFSSSVQTATVELELRNVANEQQANGSHIAVTGQNQPFEIHVIVKDGQPDENSLEIEGLDNMRVRSQGSSQSTTIINRKVSTSTDIYKLVSASQEGIQTIGPAKINVDGAVVESQSVKLIVKKEPVRQNHQPQNSTQGSVRCTLAVDKNSVVVGEPLVMTTTLYAQGNILNINFEKKPNLEGFLTKETQEPIRRNENINGQQTAIFEWKTRLVPLQSGSIKIDPATFTYAMPTPNRHRRSNGFFGGAFEEFFMGVQAEQFETSSNDITLNVSPLPDSTKQIDGIGTFASFSASLSKQEGLINEPIMLTLSIEGNGNFEQIAQPKLNLPSSCRYYDSKSDVIDTATGNKKIFEYIVQTSQSGNIQIQPQTFTYFDTASRTYKSLQTTPLQLTIHPQAQTTQQSLGSSSTTAEEIKKENPGQQEIIQENQTKKRSNLPEIPWWVFLALIIIVPCIIFYRKILAYIGSITPQKSISKRLSYLSQELDLLIKKNDVGGLYQFFLKFFAAKYSISREIVTENWIEQQLAHARWETERINKFLDFLSNCAEVHFASNKALTTNHTMLLKQARYWLTILNN